MDICTFTSAVQFLFWVGVITAPAYLIIAAVLAFTKGEFPRYLQYGLFAVFVGGFVLCGILGLLLRYVFHVPC